MKGRGKRALLLASAVLALGAAAAGGLGDVGSFGVWLQDPVIDDLVKAPHDLVVIDYSSDGSEDGEFSAAEIARVRDSGKTVLAYFSIGEVEEYRFYWRDGWRPGRPGFIAAENPDWEGNFKVKYWSERWWSNALEPYLDRILDAGFDGVYLDIVDAYWWWHEERGLSARTTANRMARLVERIALYARERAGDDFIVCPQNAVSILDDAARKWQYRYLDAIDAVGVESLFFHIWSREDRDYRLEMLDRFQDAGKTILVIEYIPEGRWDEFFDLLAGSGLDALGYPAHRDQELDELIIVE